MTIMYLVNLTRQIIFMVTGALACEQALQLVEKTMQEIFASGVSQEQTGEARGQLHLCILPLISVSSLN